MVAYPVAIVGRDRYPFFPILKSIDYTNSPNQLEGVPDRNLVWIETLFALKPRGHIGAKGRSFDDVGHESLHGDVFSSRSEVQ